MPGLQFHSYKTYQNHDAALKEQISKFIGVAVKDIKQQMEIFQNLNAEIRIGVITNEGDGSYFAVIMFLPNMVAIHFGKNPNHDSGRSKKSPRWFNILRPMTPCKAQILKTNIEDAQADANFPFENRKGSLIAAINAAIDQTNL